MTYLMRSYTYQKSIFAFSSWTSLIFKTILLPVPVEAMCHFVSNIAFLLKTAISAHEVFLRARPISRHTQYHICPWWVWARNAPCKWSRKSYHLQGTLSTHSLWDYPTIYSSGWMRVQVTGKGSGFMASGSRADFPVMCNEAGTYDFKSLSESRDSSNWIASQKKLTLDRIIAYFSWGRKW